MIAPDGERRLPTPLLIVLLVLPVVMFYGLLGTLNTGLPTEDDFHGLFTFALRWHALPDLVHRLPLVVTFQHNEYKMPVVFSLLGLELQLTHHINIPLWIWTGNLLALTILLPLWFSCAPDSPLRQRLLFFLPVLWIVMSLGYAETLDFALCGLQFVLVTTLSLQALYCITRQNTALNYLGCLLALLACMTYTNAFLLAPIGVPVLWAAGRRKVFVAWVSSFALALAVFLYRYQFLPHVWPHPERAGLFFLAVVGGPFGFHGFYAAASLCGIGLIGLIGCLAWRRADRVAPFAFWVTVWLLLSFILITFGRASGGMAGALASRYKIWSYVLLATVYLQLLAFWRSGRLPRLQRKYALPAVIVFAVFFGLGSDALGWYRLQLRRVDVLYGTGRYRQSGGALSPMVYPVTSPDFQSRPEIEKEARQLLTEVINKGIYRLPAGD